jgi:hypothetical protein
MNLEVNIPCSVKVSDYHEFNTVETYFKLLNSKIKVKEICFNFNTGTYIGIAYIGSLEAPANRNLVKYLMKQGY